LHNSIRIKTESVSAPLDKFKPKSTKLKIKKYHEESKEHRAGQKTWSCAVNANDKIRKKRTYEKRKFSRVNAPFSFILLAR